MGAAGDLVRDGQAHRFALVADLDPGQVEGVEDQIDAPPGQGGVDLVAVLVQRNGRCAGDQAAFFPQERLPQHLGVGDGQRRVGEPGVPARQGALVRLGVDPPVVDLLDPGGEQLVQAQQGRGRVGAGAQARCRTRPPGPGTTVAGAVGGIVPGLLRGGGFAWGGGDLDEELLAHGAEEPFDLSPALRAARGRMGQADVEFRACPQ